MLTTDLAGTAAIITGGTRNIGRAIAMRLAQAGADVALVYRSDDAAAARTRHEIQAATGRRAEVYRADVRDEVAVEGVVEQAVGDFGAFATVVHNAGRMRAATMPDVPTEQWRDEMAVNLDAAFFLTRALLRREGAVPPGGSIVFIASGAGHDPMAGMAPYGAAKAGLIHFAAMLSQDVGPRGVRVNVVSPGSTQTDRTAEDTRARAAGRAALGRMGTPEDVAGAVLFFASDLSAFVTGQWLRVNGGAV